MPTTTFSMRMDADLRASLDSQAKLEERSASQIAERAIRDWLARKEAFRLEMEAALAEAEEGVWISGEAVDRWVDSWGTENELPPPEPDIFPDRAAKGRNAA
jgi:predicted transcriptional regulator